MGSRQRGGGLRGWGAGLPAHLGAPPPQWGVGGPRLFARCSGGDAPLPGTFGRHPPLSPIHAHAHAHAHTHALSLPLPLPAPLLCAERRGCCAPLQAAPGRPGGQRARGQDGRGRHHPARGQVHQPVAALPGAGHRGAAGAVHGHQQVGRRTGKETLLCGFTQDRQVWRTAQTKTTRYLAQAIVAAAAGEVDGHQ